MAKSQQQRRRAAAQQTTRAQRRAQERAGAKRPQQRRGLPTGQIIGGIATIAIVVGIIIYALIQSNSHKTATKSTGPALTTPTALSPGSALNVGAKAPDFTLKGADGKSYSLAAQHGHPVLLEYFAVYCPHCQREAPIIEKLKLNYQMQGVRMWSILANPYGPNYDSSFGQDKSLATKSDLTAFANTYHEHIPQLVDPNFHVVNKYGINSYPGIYLIGKDGKILYHQDGDQTYAQLSAQIKKALSATA